VDRCASIVRQDRLNRLGQSVRIDAAIDMAVAHADAPDALLVGVAASLTEGGFDGAAVPRKRARSLHLDHQVLDPEAG